MKTSLLFAILFLTLLGTSTASGNTETEEFKVVDRAEESFIRRFTVSEDFTKRNATIEVHLTSIDMLVTVRVDTVNKINSITTTYLPGKTAQNETEPEKETEKIVTYQSQNESITNTSPPRPKTVSKQQIGQRQTANDSFTTNSWYEMAWNGFSSAMQYIIDWLCPGIRPHDINSNEFARRTITRVDFACPADGSVNHSMRDLSDMEENTCPVTWRVPLMTLTDVNINWSQNFAPEDSEIAANQIKNQTVLVPPLKKETEERNKESSKRREPIVVFMGHHNSEDELSELLPEFITVDYFGSNPEIMLTSPLQSESEENISPGSLDTVDLNEECDYVYWPNSTPEFVPAEYYGMVQSKENNESWPLKNSEIVTLILVDEENTLSTPVGNETLPDITDVGNHTASQVEKTGKCNEDVKGALNVSETPSNDTVYESVCPNQPVDAGYWIQEADIEVCTKEHETFHSGISDMAPLIFVTRSPLQGSRVINESLMCPLGANKNEPEIKVCLRNDTTWFTTKVWKRFIAMFEGSRKSGGVHFQKTQVKIVQNKWMTERAVNQSVMCGLNSKEKSPETKFCSRNDTTWLTTKLWNRFMGMFELTRKSGGDPLQTTSEKTVQHKWITEKVINQSVMCELNSKATGLETEFCPAHSPWFTTKLWNKGVATVQWLKSNETQDKARNMTKYYWTSLQTMLINWTWQDTFDVMITIWLADYCLMALYLFVVHLKKVIGLLRLRREMRQREEREERELEEERERLREIERLEREQAALRKPKPWELKHKKKRANYCGKLQKWN